LCKNQDNVLQNATACVPPAQLKRVRCHGPQEGRKLKRLPALAQGFPGSSRPTGHQHVALTTENPRKIYPCQPVRASVNPSPSPPPQIHVKRMPPILKDQILFYTLWCNTPHTSRAAILKRAHVLSGISTPTRIHHWNHRTSLPRQQASGILHL